MDWKKAKMAGIVAGAAVSVATAWSLFVVPFLNSDLSPVVGMQRFKGIEVLQQQTVKTLGEVSKTVDGVVVKLDRDACADWNRRLRQAESALEKSRTDVVARELRRTALDQLYTIPDCMLEPRPNP